MDTALQTQTSSNFKAPTEGAQSKVLLNTATNTMLSNLHHILFVHQCENVKQRT
jgi:hypothetical protein